MKNLFILFIVLFSFEVSAQSKTIVPNIVYDSVTMKPYYSGTQHSATILTDLIKRGETTSRRETDYDLSERERINSEIKKLQSEIETLKKVINILINK